MVFPDQGLRIKTPPPDIDDAISESEEGTPRVAKKAKEALERSRSGSSGKIAFVILGLIGVVGLIRSAVGVPLTPLELQFAIGLAILSYCVAIIRAALG
jgi:hypothetical protein